MAKIQYFSNKLETMQGWIFFIYLGLDLRGLQALIEWDKILSEKTNATF
jgi:hypothetical protein